jgi:hypothetical protein
MKPEPRSTDTSVSSVRVQYRPARSLARLTFSRTDETKREVLQDRLFHIFSFKSLNMASLHVFAHISQTLSRFSIIQQRNIIETSWRIICAYWPNPTVRERLLV